MPTISLTSSWRYALAGAAVLVAAWPGVAAAAQAPTISLGPVDCTAGGSVATVVNDGSVPARVALLRDEVLVATMVVQPNGLPVTQVVPIAEGSSARVDARSGGSFTSVLVRRDCSGAPQASATTTTTSASTDAGNVPLSATPVIPGTGVRGAAPATTPRPVEQPEASAVDRITDPISSWPFLVLAGLALLAAAAVAIGRVRIGARAPREPVPTPAPVTVDDARRR